MTPANQDDLMRAELIIAQVEAVHGPCGDEEKFMLKTVFAQALQEARRQGRMELEQRMPTTDELLAAAAKHRDREFQNGHLCTKKQLEIARIQTWNGFVTGYQWLRDQLTGDAPKSQESKETT